MVILLILKKTPKNFSQNDLTFIKENCKKSQREEDAQTQY